MTSKTTNKFSPEVRARAECMVLEYEEDHPSRWAAVVPIAAKIGCACQTLDEWVKKAEVDSDVFPKALPVITGVRGWYEGPPVSHPGRG